MTEMSPVSHAVMTGRDGPGTSASRRRLQARIVDPATGEDLGADERANCGCGARS